MHAQHPMDMSKHRGYGGFPMPTEILGSLFQRFFPKLQRKLTRSVTYPATTTIVSQYGGTRNTGASKLVPYITFDAVVGHNSAFHHLTNEQLEELGGVEYRALNALLYIVAGVRWLPSIWSLSSWHLVWQYHIGIQILAFIIIAPYMSLAKWKHDFEVPMQQRNVPSTWSVTDTLNEIYPDLPSQVFDIPSGVGLYQHGNVPCGPIHGSFSDSLSYNCLHAFFDPRR